jgi:hypothetical protein
LDGKGHQAPAGDREVRRELARSEIWDSREQLDAFGERLMPILGDVGIGFDRDPEIFEVYEAIRR